MDWDKHALVAAVDLVDRTGAAEFEVGYLHDNVPVHQAGWWAAAKWNGTRVTAENYPGPAEAAEALARQLLAGRGCTHCGGTIVLGGTEARDGDCRWQRVLDRWQRGCASRIPEGQRAIPTTTKRGEVPRRG